MHRRGVGSWRLVRACALTLTVLSLSSVAHLLGGGQPPPLLVVVALAALILGAALLLVGRRRGPLVVATALALGQVLVHETLMRVAMMVDTGTMPAGNPMALSTGAAIPLSGMLAQPVPSPTLAMVAWHGLATVAAAAGLAFGERAAQHLFRRALPLRPPFLRLAWLRLLLPVQAADRPPARPHPWLRSASLRGPPLSLATTIG